MPSPQRDRIRKLKGKFAGDYRLKMIDQEARAAVRIRQQAEKEKAVRMAEEKQVEF